jgi:LmbE family N-acetylglucosaminyl deacetylase
LVVLAAHPDDETLAAGGLLQRAVAASAAIRVVYATDGENNPWAQRASEHRFRIGAADRTRFGAARRAETLAALNRLGVPSECAHFLAFPDQGLTDLLTSHAALACEALAPHLAGWRPTVVAGPTAADLHPDHSALAVLARLVLAAASPGVRPRELACLVHNPALRHHAAATCSLALTAAERDRKRAAIVCHVSQLHLRGPWLRSFGADSETFLAVPWPAGAPHPVSAPHENGDQLVIAFDTHPRARSFGARTLVLIVESAGPIAALGIPLPCFSGATDILPLSSGVTTERASFVGGPWGGELRLPANLFARARRVWVKLERRFGFFDEAGWLEISIPPTQAIGDRR